MLNCQKNRLARAAGERIEGEAAAMSLTAICTTVGTTRHDATTRGKSPKPTSTLYLVFTARSHIDRVVTAVKEASPQNIVSTDARRADGHERAARVVYLASAAYLCTLTVAMAQRYRSLPSNFGDSPADGLNWPAKTVAGTTRR